MLDNGLTWAELAGIIVLFALIGQGFFFIGMLWQKVADNRRDIDAIFNRIDLIWTYVRNGGKLRLEKE